MEEKEAAGFFEFIYLVSVKTAPDIVVDLIANWSPAGSKVPHKSSGGHQVNPPDVISKGLMIKESFDFPELNLRDFIVPISTKEGWIFVCQNKDSKDFIVLYARHGVKATKTFSCQVNLDNLAYSVKFGVFFGVEGDRVHIFSDIVCDMARVVSHELPEASSCLLFDDDLRRLFSGGVGRVLCWKFEAKWTAVEAALPVLLSLVLPATDNMDAMVPQNIKTDYKYNQLMVSTHACLYIFSLADWNVIRIVPHEDLSAAVMHDVLLIANDYGKILMIDTDDMTTLFEGKPHLSRVVGAEIIGHNPYFGLSGEKDGTLLTWDLNFRDEGAYGLALTDRSDKRQDVDESTADDADSLLFLSSLDECSVFCKTATAIITVRLDPLGFPFASFQTDILLMETTNFPESNKRNWLEIYTSQGIWFAVDSVSGIPKASLALPLDEKSGRRGRRQSGFICRLSVASRGIYDTFLDYFYVFTPDGNAVEYDCSGSPGNLTNGGVFTPPQKFGRILTMCSVYVREGFADDTNSNNSKADKQENEEMLILAGHSTGKITLLSAHNVYHFSVESFSVIESLGLDGFDVISLISSSDSTCHMLLASANCRRFVTVWSLAVVPTTETVAPHLKTISLRKNYEYQLGTGHFTPTDPPVLFLAFGRLWCFLKGSPPQYSLTSLTSSPAFDSRSSAVVFHLADAFVLLILINFADQHVMLNFFHLLLCVHTFNAIKKHGILPRSPPVECHLKDGKDGFIEIGSSHENARLVDVDVLVCARIFVSVDTLSTFRVWQVMHNNDEVDSNAEAQSIFLTREIEMDGLTIGISSFRIISGFCYYCTGKLITVVEPDTLFRPEQVENMGVYFPKTSKKSSRAVLIGDDEEEEEKLERSKIFNLISETHYASTRRRMSKMAGDPYYFVDRVVMRLRRALHASSSVELYELNVDRAQLVVYNVNNISYNSQSAHEQENDSKTLEFGDIAKWSEMLDLNMEWIYLSTIWDRKSSMERSMLFVLGREIFRANSLLQAQDAANQPFDPIFIGGENADSNGQFQVARLDELLKALAVQHSLRVPSADDTACSENTDYEKALFRVLARTRFPIAPDGQLPNSVIRTNYMPVFAPPPRNPKRSECTVITVERRPSYIDELVEELSEQVENSVSPEMQQANPSLKKMRIRFRNRRAIWKAQGITLWDDKEDNEDKEDKEDNAQKTESSNNANSGQGTLNKEGEGPVQGNANGSVDGGSSEKLGDGLGPISRKSSFASHRSSLTVQELNVEDKTGQDYSRRGSCATSSTTGNSDHGQSTLDKPVANSQDSSRSNGGALQQSTSTDNEKLTSETKKLQSNEHQIVESGSFSKNEDVLLNRPSTNSALLSPAGHNNSALPCQLSSQSKTSSKVSPHHHVAFGSSASTTSSNYTNNHTGSSHSGAINVSNNATRNSGPTKKANIVRPHSSSVEWSVSSDKDRLSPESPYMYRYYQHHDKRETEKAKKGAEPRRRCNTAPPTRNRHPIAPTPPDTMETESRKSDVQSKGSDVHSFRDFSVPKVPKGVQLISSKVSIDSASLVAKSWDEREDEGFVSDRSRQYWPPKMSLFMGNPYLAYSRLSPRMRDIFLHGRGVRGKSSDSEQQNIVPARTPSPVQSQSDNNGWISFVSPLRCQSAAPRLSNESKSSNEKEQRSSFLANSKGKTARIQWPPNTVRYEWNELF